jgi:predicted DNA-binding transcriptional regulator AlpA
MQTPTIPSPTKVAALEKVPHAAKRMGISTCQTYREIKAGRLGPLVKVGERASALPTVAVDAWIQAKIDAVQGAAK